MHVYIICGCTHTCTPTHPHMHTHINISTYASIHKLQQQSILDITPPHTHTDPLLSKINLTLQRGCDSTSKPFVPVTRGCFSLVEGCSFMRATLKVDLFCWCLWIIFINFKFPSFHLHSMFHSLLPSSFIRQQWVKVLRVSPVSLVTPLPHSTSYCTHSGLLPLTPYSSMHILWHAHTLETSVFVVVNHFRAHSALHCIHIVVFTALICSLNTHSTLWLIQSGI